MEQAQRRVSEDAAVGGGERAEPIGAYLARQRVLRGISLEELSASTRIPLRSLARLEAGAFDAEPDGFVRGFVRTVALALGLPPDETVARMLPEPRDDGSRHGGLHRLARALGVGIGALLALFAAVWIVAGGRILPPGWTRSRDEIVHRRDAVRALADEEASASDGRDRPPAPQR